MLSTADPVRVYEDFATLDLLSGGRAEITAGRGAYVESFPLFGYDLDDYNELFDEKLDLLLRVNGSERVTWSGRFRPALRDAGVYPRALQESLLGQPEGFVDLAALYRREGRDAGYDDDRLGLGVTSHFYVDTTSQGARDTFYPYYSRYIGDNMPRARGQALGRDAFEAWASPRGALVCGSPHEVVDKILWEHELLGHRRCLAQIGLGGLPFAETARSIELLATDVLPVLRKAI